MLFTCAPRAAAAPRPASRKRGNAAKLLKVTPRKKNR